MNIKPLEIEGAFMVKPDFYPDNRGFMCLNFSRVAFAHFGLNCDWDRLITTQSNRSVIRGLHYQVHPNPEIKLVTCEFGTIYDVLVDTRKYSKTYGKHVGIWLIGGQEETVYIPEGVAHGYQVMEDAVVRYLIRGAYDRESERGVLWCDPELNIQWPIKDPIVSEKDSLLPQFRK